jgi:hypothetical protein
MNIVEPLYEICLDKIAQFAADRRIGPKYPEFQAELARVAAHSFGSAQDRPNRGYFIFKSIIVNNLYGVDLMEEAVEICKLRLFLKLVSQISDAEHIEPLPDIDFNIVPGNTLVGYASLAEVEQAASRSLFNLNLPQRITEADVALRAFRELQTQIGISARVLAKAKEDTKAKLAEIEAELNESLRVEYGAKKLEKFVESHRPFHWYVKFNTIMQDGGFDVLVGNPPWIEYSVVRKSYAVRGYETENCGNLYAMCIERAISLRAPHGRMSFIVQLPLVSSSRMVEARELLRRKSSSLFVVPFDDRPGKLFDGLQHCRSVVFLSEAPDELGKVKLATTRYQRWMTEARPCLFSQIEYAQITEDTIFPDLFPKFAGSLEESAFRKIKANGTQSVGASLHHEVSRHFIFYQEATQYWVKATVGLPYYAKNGKVDAPAHGRYLYFANADTANAVCAILNSSLFYAYFIAFGDCFHLSDGLVSEFPITPEMLHDRNLIDLAKQLMTDLKANSVKKTISTTGGDEITYAEFYGGQSKPIIDEIDRVLARHYGFTDEEVEFIINYDIKYRMGKEAEKEE